MILTLAEMGFEIISSHHEIAPAQHEIDFHYDEAMVTADNLMTFKMVVKTIAKKTWTACYVYAKAKRVRPTVRECISIFPFMEAME